MDAEQKFAEQMKVIFDAIYSESICVHTAVAPLGFFPLRATKEQGLDAYLEIIFKCAGERTLLFPAFNYDFCRNGVYDVQKSPCQVGLLNEHARRFYPNERTHTPVFNFAIFRNRGFSIAPYRNVFGKDSTFAELVKNKATILFIGANLTSNTFVHHVEEVVGVGYRYPKIFSGVIRTGSDARDSDFDISYRVRPLEIDTSRDWAVLTNDLVKRGYLRKFRLGRGFAYFYRADEVFDYWCSCVEKDELFLTSPPSRDNIEILYKKYGKPLTYEALET